jgi:hypothetical protein
MDECHLLGGDLELTVRGLKSINDGVRKRGINW